MFRNLFDSVHSDTEYEIFDVREEIYPRTLNNDDIYLIPGSNAGAYDDTLWVQTLIKFIRKMYMENVKIAGVCFGHQIIAQALGGKTEKAVQGWGAGVRTSNIIDSKAIAYFPDKTMNLHYNHHDQVTELPPQAVCFAQSDFCPYEGFYINNRIITFQGHPEYTADYSRYLLLNHSDDEPEDVKLKALDSLSLKVDSLSAAKWILNLN
jgi:GMP synthase-like glutamine amidotransferase